MDNKQYIEEKLNPVLEPLVIELMKKKPDDIVKM
jgi:hypothetical protein